MAASDASITTQQPSFIRIIALGAALSVGTALTLLVLLAFPALAVIERIVRVDPMVLLVHFEIGRGSRSRFSLFGHKHVLLISHSFSSQFGVQENLN